MRKITNLFFAAAAFVAFGSSAMAQSSHTVGFESAADGAGWTWTMAENGTNPALEFIANPVSGGINTSANVAKFTALQTGNAWALVFPKYFVERKNTYEPILTGCKVLTTTRAKKALNKLINAGYNAKMMLLNNKIILIYKN